MRTVLKDKMFTSKVVDLFKVSKIVIKFLTCSKSAPSKNAIQNMGALQNFSLKKCISELLSLKYTY